MINERCIDDFLCVERHLDLSMELGEYKINIVPYKAHFLVTVYKDGIEIEQLPFNYWNDAFDEFKKLCNKYIATVFSDRVVKMNTNTVTESCDNNSNDDIAW